MQRRVDPEDYRSLTRAKGIIDDAFSGGGTDWFPGEQVDLHDAASAVARLLDSLQQETPIKAIASRIVTADWGRVKELTHSQTGRIIHGTTPLSGYWGLTSSNPPPKNRTPDLPPSISGV